MRDLSGTSVDMTDSTRQRTPDRESAAGQDAAHALTALHAPVYYRAHFLSPPQRAPCQGPARRRHPAELLQDYAAGHWLAPEGLQRSEHRPHGPPGALPWGPAGCLGARHAAQQPHTRAWVRRPRQAPARRRTAPRRRQRLFGQTSRCLACPPRAPGQAEKPPPTRRPARRWRGARAPRLAACSRAAPLMQDQDSSALLMGGPGLAAWRGRRGGRVPRGPGRAPPAPPAAAAGTRGLHRMAAYPTAELAAKHKPQAAGKHCRRQQPSRAAAEKNATLRSEAATACNVPYAAHGFMQSLMHPVVRMPSPVGGEFALRTISTGGRPANEPRVAPAANDMRAGEEHQLAVFRLVKAHGTAQHTFTLSFAFCQDKMHRRAAVRLPLHCD